MKLLPSWFWHKIIWRMMLKMTLREWKMYLKVIGRKTPIETDPYMKITMLYEEKEWEKEYLPLEGIKGKRILDVGAGCGETAWFFFKHGASTVVCIEPDPDRFRKLLRNAKRFNWDVRCYNREFRRSDLFNRIDFAKIDCEGGEDVMLDIEESKLPPLVMEIHYKERYNRFRTAFPNMKTHRRDERELWMATNCVMHSSFPQSLAPVS